MVFVVGVSVLETVSAPQFKNLGDWREFVLDTHANRRALFFTNSPHRIPNLGQQVMKEESQCREECRILPGTDEFEIDLPDRPLSSPQNHSLKWVTIAPQEVKVKVIVFYHFWHFINFQNPNQVLRHVFRLVHYVILRNGFYICFLCSDMFLMRQR